MTLPLLISAQWLSAFFKGSEVHVDGAVLKGFRPMSGRMSDELSAGRT